MIFLFNLILIRFDINDFFFYFFYFIVFTYDIDTITKKEKKKKERKRKEKVAQFSIILFYVFFSIYDYISSYNSSRFICI